MVRNDPLVGTWASAYQRIMTDLFRHSGLYKWLGKSTKEENDGQHDQKCQLHLYTQLLSHSGHCVVQQEVWECHRRPR